MNVFIYGWETGWKFHLTMIFLMNFYEQIFLKKIKMRLNKKTKTDLNCGLGKKYWIRRSV